MDNKAIIEDFYTAFARADAEGMVRHYHPDIRFEDPAFGPLQGERAKNMWRMLINNNKTGIDIKHDSAQANAQTGSANWQARYIFSQTGRPVLNKITASFEFKDGKIIRHTDHFDMWAWSRQALGWKGWLLGWTAFLKSKIQQQTNRLLDKYEAGR